MAVRVPGDRIAAVTGKIDVRGWQPPVANAAAGFDEPHGAKATVLASDAG